MLKGLKGLLENLSPMDDLKNDLNQIMLMRDYLTTTCDMCEKRKKEGCTFTDATNYIDKQIENTDVCNCDNECSNCSEKVRNSEQTKNIFKTVMTIPMLVDKLNCVHVNKAKDEKLVKLFEPLICDIMMISVAESANNEISLDAMNKVKHTEMLIGGKSINKYVVTLADVPNLVETFFGKHLQKFRAITYREGIGTDYAEISEFERKRLKLIITNRLLEYINMQD